MKNKILILSVIAASISMLSLQKEAAQKEDIIPKYSLGLPFAVGSLPTNCDAIIQAAISGEPVVGLQIGQRSRQAGDDACHG